MAQAFLGVVTVLLMCAVGFVLYRRRAMDDKAVSFISVFSVKVSIPCVMYIRR